VVALDDLSFSVREGQMFGFVGPNGAGRTTAMRIVLGVLEPDAGEVRWRGRSIDDEIRRRVGYMPEDHGQTFSPLFACLQACHRHAGDASIDASVGGRLGACAQR
jgi:ABC-type multidrug transport system ATPase subunit